MTSRTEKILIVAGSLAIVGSAVMIIYAIAFMEGLMFVKPWGNGLILISVSFQLLGIIVISFLLGRRSAM